MRPQTSLLAATMLLLATTAFGQLSAQPDVNTSKKSGDDNECAIANDPTNKNRVFIACNTSTGGLFAAKSNDRGSTWTYPDPADKTIADGDAGQGPAACCDPSLTWDTFGNLYLTYIDAGLSNIVTILSTDGGSTWNTLANFGPASVDQPTIVSANTTAAGAPVAVWIVWNQGGQMVARGAPVTGSGVVNVGAFTALQTIPGTAGCSFGDVAIAPSGAVVQACQNPTSGEGPATIFVNTDADGLGPGNFGPAVTATTTNVGGFDYIPAQNARSIDAEAGLAFDANDGTISNPPTPPGPSPHLGRLYLVYTEETPDESNDTDIMLRFSDDTGASWSAPQKVNDDGTTRSQFLPKIASNPLSGNITICWHDARNSASNTAVQIYCTMATPTAFPAPGAAPVFIGPNYLVSDGSSTSNGAGVEFGDYAGLAYFRGEAHPAWADTSNSTGDNPNLTANFDAYTARLGGGAASNEGDPHITTVDGVPYDFQGGGEFVVLRDGDRMKIQTRQTPIPSAPPIGNAWTGLTVCVSLNTAVAVRVGTHRVTYEPNVNGHPDPSGMQLRVDGVLRTLSATGITLSGGGRVSKTSAPGGIQIDFPDGTILQVTPGWWSSQGKWFLNVDVPRTMASDGIMGSLAPGSWLPALPNGASLGPKPASAHQRYIDLYQTFADAWRVTPKTSLFDYAPGTSTATFTNKNYPPEAPPCDIPGTTTPKPLSEEAARAACANLTNKMRIENCIFDVMLTGDTVFAKTYLATEAVHRRTVFVTLTQSSDVTRPEIPVTFEATVSHLMPAEGAPRGSIQFMIGDANASKPVPLDRYGRATWKTESLKPGKYTVTAIYIPAQGSDTSAASSAPRVHTVMAVRSRVK